MLSTANSQKKNPTVSKLCLVSPLRALGANIFAELNMSTKRIKRNIKSNKANCNNCSSY